MKRILALACLAFALGSCGRQPIGSTDPGVGAQAFEGNMPAPDISEQVGSSRAYHIGPGDKLEISLFGVEELARREFVVDTEGRLSYPLVGEINVLGRTPGEVEQQLAQGLRNGFVRDPQLTVNLVETHSQLVTVDGAVMQPGLYPALPSLTLMRTIAQAKGLSEYGDVEDVAIFRTVNGQRLAGIYNLGAIRRGAYNDPPVYPNDIVVVGESARRRLLKDGVPLVSAIVTPLVYLLAR